MKQPNHDSTLLAAYRLRDRRIAQRLRGLANTLSKGTALHVLEALSVLPQCADELEREFTPQEAATKMHLDAAQELGWGD